MRIASVAFLILLTSSALGQDAWKPSAGDCSGNECGPAVDVDCPATPFDDSPLASEQTKLKPVWGCVAGEPCGYVKQYYGDEVVGHMPNRAMCEYHSDYSNKHIMMERRCWPKWHGVVNTQGPNYHC